MMPLLALNCGSSSLKFGVFNREEVLFEGEVQEIQSYSDAFSHVCGVLADHGYSRFSAFGHRLVHGGPHLRDHTRLTGAVREQLNAAVPFAPLHLPPALSVIDASQHAFGGMPQIVCLDTAFHRSLPPVAQTLPLPADIRAQGIERYGFHGLSLESIVAQLKTVPARTVIAHLGSGASVTALLEGKSIDTTMGLTPTGGFMMGTRTGDLDPGVILYLLRHGFDADRLEALLDHASGLKGVSGQSSDVRALNNLRQTDPNCALALNMFCYQVKKSIAGMVAALGGLDLLVFTGGIGEHDAALRTQILDGLPALTKFEVKALPAQEDLQIARIAHRLLA